MTRYPTGLARRRFALSRAGALDFGGEPVQLPHDGGEEVDWFGEDIFDSEAHGFALGEFHLQEADLHVDELVDQCHFFRC